MDIVLEREDILARLHTSVISDTLDSLGLRHQALRSFVRPLDDGLTMFGRARTGLYASRYHVDPAVNPYAIEMALIDDLAKDEVVVLACQGPSERIAPWGELLSTAAAARGAAGCVTDGLVRDIRQIRAMQFPVFHGGIGPLDSKGRGEMIDKDVPVEVVDDALALAFAIRSRRADVVAVTTLAGNVDVEQTTSNTLTVVDWLGATALPVYRGASRPLVRPHQDAVYFHDADGLGGAELPRSERAVGPHRGPAAIVRLASERPGDLTLVCVGPLTNLAIALNVEPRLPDLLRGVVVMGGAFAVPGNVTPVAEFNVYADPEAAAQVFAAPFARLSVVGLDVTQQTALPRQLWEAATRQTAADAAVSLVAAVCRRAFTVRDLPRFYLHDPLAVAVALDDSIVGWEDATIEVGVGETERGGTRVVGAGSARIGRSVDAERFHDRFFDALGLSGLVVSDAV